MINLNAPAPDHMRALNAPAPVGALLALALVVLAAVSVPSLVAFTAPTPGYHTVLAGVSAYPAQASAEWIDQDGAAHILDPWADHPERVPAASVVVVVSGAGLSCSLVVDGTTMDTQVAVDGRPAVCTWSVRRV